MNIKAEEITIHNVIDFTITVAIKRADFLIILKKKCNNLSSSLSSIITECTTRSRNAARHVKPRLREVCTVWKCPGFTRCSCSWTSFYTLQMPGCYSATLKRYTAGWYSSQNTVSSISIYHTLVLSSLDSTVGARQGSTCYNQSKRKMFTFKPESFLARPKNNSLQLSRKCHMHNQPSCFKGAKLSVVLGRWWKAT